MVQHGVDAKVVVDVFDPLPRYSRIDADGVHPDILKVAHLIVEYSPDEFGRILPDAVFIVRTDGVIVPVHAIHHEGISVYHQHPAVLIFPNFHNVCRRRSARL